MIEARFGNAYFWDSLLMVAWAASAFLLIVIFMLPTMDVMVAFLISLMSLFMLVSAWRVMVLWSDQAARVLKATYVLSLGALYWIGLNTNGGGVTIYIAGAVLPAILVAVLWTILPLRCRDGVCCRRKGKGRLRPILIRGSYKLVEQT